MYKLLLFTALLNIAGAGKPQCPLNEIFTNSSCNSSICESICGIGKPLVCNRQCPNECICKDGYSRNEKTAKCVLSSQCVSQTILQEQNGKHNISKPLASNDNITELYDACTTKSCRNSVERVVKGMDPTVKPCDDFYQFACGTYENSTDYDGKSNYPRLNMFAELYEKIKNQLISSLEKNIHVNDSEPIKIAKYFYQSCHNKSIIDSQSLAPFLNIIEQVGGWPVLKNNETWNETAFNWTRVIFKIGNNSFWDINLVPMIIDIKAPKANPKISLGLSAVDLLDGEKNDKVKKYFKYMVDVAVSMGADEAYAKKELNETLQFEIKLANATLFDRNSNKSDYITISELIKRFPLVPWDEYINTKLPPGIKLEHIHERTLIYNLDYIDNLKDFIESTPTKVIANYIVWRYVNDFGYYLNKNIHDIKKNYEKPSTDNGDTDKNTDTTLSKECLQSISADMPEVLSTLYIRDHFDKNTDTNVSVVFDNVRDAFIELLQDSNWMDDSTKDRMTKKALKMYFTTGLLEKVDRDLKTNESLRGFQFVDNSYAEAGFNKMIYMDKFKWKHLDPMIRRKYNEWERLKTYDIRRSNAEYIFYTNTVLTTPGLLQNPLYSHDFPLFMIYGALGFHLGHEIGHGFDSTLYKFDDSIYYLDLPDETDIKYREKVQCFFEQYSNYQYLEMLDPNEAIDENIVDNIGIRAAYRAYEKFAKMDKSQRIRGHLYSPRQMFWISTASTWCEIPGSGNHGFSHSPNKYRVIGPFSNMKEFARDFNCPIDSPMNPSEKCRIW